MSRQIQIRRGTTTEHSGFTGVIGEVTMNTDKKTLCVHDGVTAGGIQLARKDEIPEQYIMPINYDFVIETGGTSSAWYRKYKSGWIEQGGTFTGVSSSAGTVLTFPVAFTNTSFQIYFGTGSSTASTSILSAREVINNRSISSTNILTLANNSYVAITVYWHAKGFYAV